MDRKPYPFVRRAWDSFFNAISMCSQDKMCLQERVAIVSPSFGCSYPSSRRNYVNIDGSRLSVVRFRNLDEAHGWPHARSLDEGGFWTPGSRSRRLDRIGMLISYQDQHYV